MADAIEGHKHAARVYLQEARNRRGQAFAWTLLQWAANARLRATPAAVAAPEQAPAPTLPAQMELFA